MNSIIITLDKLFFDPNNYRLRNLRNFKFISSSNVFSMNIQKKVFNMIAGDGNSEIKDLIQSFKSNGYLKVDNILVRKLSGDKYLVIEGNRRLAALKVLKDNNEKGEDIGRVDKKIFTNGIEVVLYDFKDESDYLVLMGLKHVSGNKKWDRYNQAKLLYELRVNEKFSDIDIATKVGINNTAQVEREIRGYIATEKFIQTIRDESFSRKYNPYDKIMIFIEVTSKPKLRNWIGWDDKKGVFLNKKNMERFFSWIKPGLIYDEESEEYDEVDPIIVSHKEVRALEEFISDEEALSLMEENRDFRFALEQNIVYSQKQFSKTIKDVEKILRNIKMGSSLHLDKSDKECLKTIKSMIDKLLQK